MKRFILAVLCFLVSSAAVNAAPRDEVLMAFIDKHVFYHGTIAANLDGIQEEGLIPHEGVGATYEREHLDPNCKDHVYVTDNIALAWTYTQEALHRLADSLDQKSEIKTRAGRASFKVGHPVIVGIYQNGMKLENDDAHNQFGAYRVKGKVDKDRLFYISPTSYHLDEAIEANPTLLKTMVNQVNLSLAPEQKYTSLPEFKKDFVLCLRKSRNGSLQLIWEKMKTEFMDERTLH
jgi:hypothetical protein